MNVSGSGRKLLRGNASKSGGSSPVRCCHWVNCGALGSDLSIHSRWARRSCSGRGPERIGERHERDGEADETVGDEDTAARFVSCRQFAPENHKIS